MPILDLLAEACGWLGLAGCCLWTFARTLGSRDPNWQLVATEAGQ